jgi:hypothetical protein
MLALLNAALRPSLGGFNWGGAYLIGVKNFAEIERSGLIRLQAFHPIFNKDD